MIIKKTDIEGFGKFSNKSFSFRPGFNLIYGNNEDGKTTLMSFIKLMFFSSSSKSEKVQDLFKSLRKKYRPWNGLSMSGAIEFESGNKEWRLHKEFLKSDASDKTTVFCKTTGEEEKIPNPNDAGEHFFCMNAGEFDRSIFIGSYGGFAADASGDSLAMRISNLSVSGDENISQEIVLKRLSDALEELVSKSGKKGLLVECDAQLDALQLKAQQLNLQNRLQKELFEEISSIETEISNYEKTLKSISDSAKLASAKKDLNAYYTLNNKINLSKNLDKQLAKYGKNIGELKTHIQKAEELENTVSHTSQELESLSARQTSYIPEDVFENAAKSQEKIEKIRESLELLHTRIANTKDDFKKALNVAAKSAKLKAIAVLAVSLAAGGGILGFGIYSRLNTLLFLGLSLILAGGILGTALYLILPKKASSSFAVQLAKRDFETALRSLSFFEEDMISKEITDIEKDFNTKLSNELDTLDKILSEHNCETFADLKSKTALRENEKTIALQNRLNFEKDRFIGHMMQLKPIDSFVAAKILFNEIKESLRTLSSILKDIETICDTAGISDASENFVSLQIKQLTEFIQNAPPTDSINQPNAAECEARLSELRKKLGECQSRIQLPDISEAELNSQISELETEQQKLKSRFDELSIASSVMSEAITETNKGLGSYLSKKTGEYLSAITRGKYSEVLVPRNLSLETRLGEGDAFHEWKYLSGGAIDKIYLALRLAATDILSKDHEPLPLFLDDILTQYDDESQKTALEFLKEYLEQQSSASQILFFTCHKDIAEKARNIFSDINEISL